MHPGRQIFNMATLSKDATAGQIWQTQSVTKLEKIREGSRLFPSLLGKTLSSELQMERKGTLGSGDSWEVGTVQPRMWRWNCASKHRRAQAPAKTPALLPSPSPPRDLAALSLKHYLDTGLGGLGTPCTSSCWPYQAGCQFFEESNCPTQVTAST